MSLQALVLLVSAVIAGPTGTTFFVVGDYGEVQNLEQANVVFDAINNVVGQGVADTIGKPEFFVACGDNIYPAVPAAPTAAEFE
jgi:hypothetical protein